MGPLDSEARAKGYTGMEATLTVAERVYRSFRAGRPHTKSRLMQPMDALAEVWEMRDKLRHAMQKAGLDPQDTAAAIVFQVALDEPPQVAVVRVGKETDVLDKMLGRFQAVTVGCIFALVDRQRGKTRLWAYPFLLSHEALQMMERALDSQEFKGALPS